jgi:hypothetical protein
LDLTTVRRIAGEKRKEAENERNEIQTENAILPPQPEGDGMRTVFGTDTRKRYR